MSNLHQSGLAIAALDSGALVLSDRPGFGITFNQDIVNRFGVT
jgi:hypothetical protein